MVIMHFKQGDKYKKNKGRLYVVEGNYSSFKVCNFCEAKLAWLSSNLYFCVRKEVANDYKHYLKHL